jgi:hypothetical protein
VNEASEKFYTLTAVTPRQRRENVEVRYRVFSTAPGYDAARPVLPFEMDALDVAEETCLINAYHEDRCVGAARLLLPCPELARRHGLEIGLPLARKYDLRELLAEGSLAEPARLCVVSEFRGSRVAPVLIGALLDECRRRGVDLLVAGASTDTDCLQDATIQRRVLEARGLVSNSHRLPRKGGDEVTGHPVLAFYDAAQRRSAARGELDGLPLARTLTLYARGGARFLGEPALDPMFGLYVIPLIVRVGDASEVFPGIPRAA